MKISELVLKLTAVKNILGDVDVIIDVNSVRKDIGWAQDYNVVGVNLNKGGSISNPCAELYGEGYEY